MKKGGGTLVPPPEFNHEMVSPLGLGLHVGVDVVERRRQLVTNCAHCGHGSNCDQSSNQAIFDGGRALGVLDELEKLCHDGLHIVQCSTTRSFPLNRRNNMIVSRFEKFPKV
jgi:hypothetical protein